MARQSTVGAAGDYWNKVTWLQHSYVTDTNNGQKKDTYADNGKLWCWVEEKKAKEEPQYGARNHVVEVSVHLRGYPEVGEKDRFYDNYAERTYEVKAILYDFNAVETVVEGYMIPTLQ